MPSIAIRIRSAAMFLVAVFVTWSTTPAFSADRDQWHSISDGTQRYGFVHSVVRRLEDGTFEYRVDSLVKIEMLGMPQEHARSVVAVLDPGLRPLRFESSTRQASGDLVLRGRITAEGYELESSSDGKESRWTVVAPDGEIGMTLDVALADWLHGKTSEWTVEGGSRRVRLFSSSGGGIDEASVRRLPGPVDDDNGAGSVWEVSLGEYLPPMRLELGRDGSVIRQTQRVPPIRMEAATRDVAEACIVRRIPDRELLFFTPKTSLPPQHRLASVTIDLEWTGIAPEEFRLTDSRQQVTSLVADGDRRCARVVLARPGELAVSLTLPVDPDRLDELDVATRAEIAAALGETDFIRPKDSRISARAREIVGEETNALAATTAICRWVSGYLEPAMIAETLAGPDVLERRTGKCSEYTTLFASLARSVGIPTRVALGQRRFLGSGGDTWGGHMWNEVFVGEWIPVDASVNEVGGSTSLLKFVHSDSVMGTQRLRWLLTESLEVTISSHESIPRDPLGEARVTGLEGGAYTDAERGFRIHLPDGGWRVESVGSPQSGTLRLYPPEGSPGSSAKIHMVVFPLGGGIPPRTVLAGRITAHRAALEKFELIRDVERSVAGLPGHDIRFEGMPKSASAGPLRVTEVVWVGRGQGFLLNLIADVEGHDAQLAHVAAIVDSFELLEE